MVLWISLKMLVQVWIKVPPDAVIPRTSLICDVTMIRATADVKPDDTGPETKSMRNPRVIKVSFGWFE